MVTRIHHTKEGVEYVLQYNIRSDTIELRIIKYSLLGRFPNYFRHKSGTSFLEIATFKEVLRSIRTASGVDWFPELTEDEAALIHAFEETADIHLLLTPKSVSKYCQTAMQGAANGLQAVTESLRETARALQGLDLRPLIASTNILANLQLGYLARSAAFNPPPQVNATDPPPPPPTDEPPIPQEAPILRNTEGLTEAQIQETEAFVARLLNGETLSAREHPPLPTPNSEDASTPDPNTTEIDAFLKELDAVLDGSTHETDEVWGAPTHTPLLNAETVKQLWKQANQQD